MTDPSNAFDQLVGGFSGPETARIRQALAAIIAREKPALVQTFYAYMLKDAAASTYLSAKSIEDRLRPGLENWLERLFCHDTEAELHAVLAAQRQIGEIHARAEIPIHLVARGMRLLKREIASHLMAGGLDAGETVVAVMHMEQLIDIAFEEMSSAFVHSRETGVRTEEAYRMLSVGHNLSLEREKQVRALLEWENRLFRALATGGVLNDVTELRGSSFGLWLHHKAALIFDETRELPLIDDCLQRIDKSLTAWLAPGARIGLIAPETRSLVRSVTVELEQIKFLLTTMFDRLTDMEIGRDVLTQLFNRRFLPTILKREIELYRRQGTPFSVLMIDVDHFKQVNDEYGHDAGDRTLQFVAALLLHQVRASDFVFRYGGEEFLVVLGEAPADRATLTAEKIRQRVEATEIPISDTQAINITLSIGVAAHEGHPDFLRLVECADKALFEAKRAGRNRVVVAAN